MVEIGDGMADQKGMIPRYVIDRTDVSLGGKVLPQVEFELFQFGFILFDGSQIFDNLGKFQIGEQSSRGKE